MSIINEYRDAYDILEATEEQLLTQRRRLSSELEHSKAEVMDICVREGVSCVKLPPPEEDPDGKPLYLTYNPSHKTGGSSLTAGVLESAIFGSKEERESGEVDLGKRWSSKLKDALGDLIAKKKEKDEKSKKTKKNQEKTRRERNRIVASIKKQRAEEKTKDGASDKKKRSPDKEPKPTEHKVDSKKSRKE